MTAPLGSNSGSVVAPTIDSKRRRHEGIHVPRLAILSSGSLRADRRHASVGCPYLGNRSGHMTRKRVSDKFPFRTYRKLPD